MENYLYFTVMSRIRNGTATTALKGEKLEFAPWKQAPGGSMVAGPVMATIRGNYDFLPVEEQKSKGKYNAKIEALYKQMETLPQQEWNEKVRSLPDTAKLLMAANIDGEALRTDENLQRRLLVLCAVPEEAIEKAFAPAIPGMSRETRLSQFRANLTLEMLPREMRAPTRAIILKAVQWADKNKNRIAELAEDWKNAKDGSARHSILVNLFMAMQKDMVPDGVRIDLHRGASNAPLYYNRQRNTIIIYENHPAFTGGNDPDAMLPQYFERAVAAMAHEVTHAHQYPEIPDMGETDKPIKCGPLGVNGSRFIPFSNESDNNNPYVLQPIELQGHLVQNALLKHLQKR